MAKDSASPKEALMALQGLGAEMEDYDNPKNATWVNLGEDSNGDLVPGWKFTDEYRALLEKLPNLLVVNIPKSGITSAEAKEFEKALNNRNGSKKCTINRF